METEWTAAAERFRKILGYGPGERLSTPEQVAEAMRGIASRHRETCRLEEYGRTFEGRPLQLLTIASPDNLKRLETIRAANQAIVLRPNDVPPADLPATVWVIANVHGDEHSTAEAALVLACHLCDGGDPLLENAVVCIDPCQNPDGRARSVSSYYSLFGLKPRRDSNAAEHHDPWGGGRGNHYFFDMNRDWFPVTQPESRARVAAFLNWRPQIVADLHEMWWDSRYFFPPPANPLNPNLGEHVIRWWRDLGREIARTFDANGWDYWTAEVFDAFFPGYGEAFPSIHGAIGMTFEQAAVAGIEVERKDGTLLTFEEAVHHHYAASLTVCRVAADHRETLLADTRAYFAAAAELHGAFVFPDAGPGKPAERLAELLSSQGILVEQLTKDVQRSVTPYEGGEEREERIAGGALVVRLNQPEGRAAKAILERETTLDEEFLTEQIRRLDEHAATEIYDHTAWALPLAMGLKAFSTDAGGLPLNLWVPGETTAPAEAGYGYVIPSHGMDSLKTVCALMKGGARVHVSRKEFGLGGVDYARGTCIVKRADQTTDWAGIVSAVGQTAVAVDSAWTDGGISLGSDYVALAKAPRVAVLYGEPCSTLSYGWMAHLFEQRLDVDFTPIRVSTLKEADLRRYDVIVLPNGNKDAYAGHVVDDSWKALHDWVRQGGTLIALGGATECIAAKGKDWTTCRVVKDLREPVEAEAQKKDEPVPPEFRPERIAGAALRVALDRHHWAPLGFGPESHVIYATELLLTPSAEGRNVAVFAPVDRLVVAGFVWEKMRPALAGKAYLVDETLGRGHLLLFADDPNQRGYWDVTSRLFVNAVLLGPR